MKTLTRARSAVAWLARKVFWLALTRHPLTPDVLPDFPLRCMGCDERIRLAGVESSGHPIGGPAVSLFSDQGGHVCCDLDHQILHRPMPSVLG